MLDARAEILTATYRGHFDTVWDGDYEREISVPRADINSRLAIIDPNFWKRNFADAGVDATGFDGGISADWEAGDFVYWNWDLGAGEDTVSERHVAVGVAFNRRQLHAFLGQPLVGSLPDAQLRTRSSTYDWEAAFADVAAEFYHGLEFANLDARGVQTEIIKRLRSSFELRGMPVPSDDTLKPKANKLLGALRAKKP